MISDPKMPISEANAPRKWSSRTAGIIARNWATFCKLARHYGDNVAAELLTQLADSDLMPSERVAELYAKADENGVLASGEGWSLKIRPLV